MSKVCTGINTPHLAFVSLTGICGCRFFGFYKDIGAVLYPGLPNMRKVEDDLNRLLQNRANEGGIYKPDSSGLMKPFGMSLPFISLLFAILASGSQLSDLSGSERRLTSWVYGA